MARKRTAYIPDAPREVHVSARRADGVTMECLVDDPEGSPIIGILVEQSLVRSWVQASCEFGFHESDDGDESCCAPTARHCWVRLSGLVPETTTSVRIWAVNEWGCSAEASAICECRTAGRPPPVEGLNCTKRGTDANKARLDLEWQCSDVIVRECKVEYAQDTKLSLWKELPQSEVRMQEAKHMRPRPQESGCSQWTAKIVGLAKDTAYVVRVSARNEVGWSTQGCKSTLKLRTAQPPQLPQRLSCVRCSYEELDIAFDVLCSRAQLECMPAVTEVCVQELGLLHQWKSRPKKGHSLKVCGIDASRADDPDLCICRCLVTVRGLAREAWHELRIWVANSIGWHPEVPYSIRCHTVLKPEAPKEVVACIRGPSCIGLHWLAAQPAIYCDEAAISECCVEARQNKAISPWRMASGLQAPVGNSHFEQWVDDLTPGTEYFFRVRLRNGVGWSPWSADCPAHTPQAPRVRQCMAKAHKWLDAGCNKQACVVDVMADSPVGAPVVLCVVTCDSTGEATLAYPVGPAVWQAVFPNCAKERPGFQARCANSVGWSTSVKSDPKGAIVSNQMVSGRQMDHEAMAIWTKLTLSEASTQCDTFQTTFAHRAGHKRVEAAQKLAEILESLSEGVGGLESPGFDSWNTRCLDCKNLWSNYAGWPITTGVWSDLALQAFALLIEGILWLVALHAEVLRAWQDACDLATRSSMERLLEVWTREQDLWSERARVQLFESWQKALVTAVRLLALCFADGAVDSLARHVSRDLAGLQVCFRSAQQYLQKLRRLTSGFRQVTDGGNSQSFKKTSMKDKVGQTALGVLLSVLMPIPGSMELGAINIGMIWHDADLAGRHAIVEHCREHGAASPLQRFQQQPSEEDVPLLEDWASGSLGNAALVHNATAKAITVTLLEVRNGIGGRIYTKLQQAHPYTRIFVGGVTKLIRKARLHGEEAEQQEDAAIVLAPATVERIALPPAAESAEPRSFVLQFDYSGPRGGPIGKAAAKPGMAVTLVSFDTEVRVDNRPGASTVDSDSGAAALIEVNNKDTLPATFTFYHTAQHLTQRLFNKQLLSREVAAGESVELRLPLRAEEPGLPLRTEEPGDEHPGSEQLAERHSNAKPMFDVEVRSEAGGKAVYNMCPGQVLHCEAVL